MATNQFINFSIILYEYPTQDLLCLLGVEEYAFIEHLYDFDEYGQHKKIHYHLYVKLFKKKTISGIYEIIQKWKENATQPFLIINLNNVPKYIRYLTHIDNIDKYQYSINDIVSNMDLEPFFNLVLSDLQFTKNVIELINRKEIKNFKELVYFSTIHFKLDLVMKRAFFFKQLF